MNDQIPGSGLARQSVLDRLSILDVYQYVAGFSATTNSVHGGFMVRCPTADHDDNHPSCILNNEKNSWKCFGCGESGGKLKMVIAAGKATTNAKAASWLEKNSGIEVEFKKQPLPKPEHMRGADSLLNRVETGRYQYRDEERRTIYTVVRFDGEPAFDGARTKNFEVWSTTKTKRRVPYNLPDLVDNAKLEIPKDVHIYEGEGKADLLKRMGYLAVSGFGGATWDWPTTWTRFFEHARRIYVHTDSDKIGRRVAQQHAALLTTPKCTPVVVDYYPHRDDGSDVRDFLRELKDQNIKLTEAKIRLEEILRVSANKKQ